MKKPPGDIISLHKCTKTHDHTLYYSWDMVCDGYNFYFSFWAIFCPFTPVTAQKQNISKKWKKKKSGYIVTLHMSTINQNQDVWFLR